MLLCGLALTALGWSRMVDQRAERARSRALDVVVTWRPLGHGTPTFGALMRRAARAGAPIRLEPSEVDALGDAVRVIVRGGRSPEEGVVLKVRMATRAVEPESTAGQSWLSRLPEIESPP